jgi:hypothetical protein
VTPQPIHNTGAQPSTVAPSAMAPIVGTANITGNASLASKPPLAAK